MDSGKAKIRESTVAGIFYPEQAEELDRELDRLFRAPAIEVDGQPVIGARAIVSPHAGLGYSGDLAALAWRSVAPREIKTVVILSPLHRAEEVAVYLPESDWFSTPAGPIEVDRRLVDDILDCGTLFRMNDIPHFEEHGVELQLPFMKRLYPDASLVPLLVGRSSAALVKSLAAALGLVFSRKQDNCLFVISTDLATGFDPAVILAQSDKLLTLISKGEWEAILDHKSRDPHGACGAACIAAWLASSLARGTQCQVLGRHDSSQSRQSEQERLVEYAALAFVKGEREGNE